MEPPQRPGPVVTVHDPSRPEAAPDVLDSGPDRPPLLTRRRVVTALTAAVVLAGISGVVELRERRALAAEERRLASQVVLSLPEEAPSGGASYDGSGGQLQAQVLVRNDGPRDVEVLDASTAGFVLRQESIPLPAGETRLLDLSRDFSCEQGRPALLQLDALEIAVRTGAGTTTVELPLSQPPFAPDEPARLCGWVPVDQAMYLGVMDGQQAAGVLRMDVQLDNASRFPLEVVDLQAGPGLQVELLQVGGASGVPLPTTLPAAEGGWTSVPYEVHVRVVDCALARQQELGVLSVDVRQDGVSAQTLADYDPRLLSDLLSSSCP